MLSARATQLHLQASSSSSSSKHLDFCSNLCTSLLHTNTLWMRQVFSSPRRRKQVSKSGCVCTSCYCCCWKCELQNMIIGLRATHAQLSCLHSNSDTKRREKLCSKVSPMVWYANKLRCESKETTSLFAHSLFAVVVVVTWSEKVAAAAAAADVVCVCVCVCCLQFTQVKHFTSYKSDCVCVCFEAKTGSCLCHLYVHML